MFLTILCGFFGVVLYQTIAKKTNLPLVSDGLEYIQGLCTSAWEFLGRFVGKCLNFAEWYEFFHVYLVKIWDFILEHVWEYIRPFFESIWEIFEPLLKIVFSWVHFLIGFSQVKYEVLSYMGGISVLLLVYFYDEKYWLAIAQKYDNHYIESYVFLMILIVLGACVVYREKLHQIFPNIHKFMEEEKHRHQRGRRRNELYSLKKEYLLDILNGYDPDIGLTMRNTKYDIIDAIIMEEF